MHSLKQLVSARRASMFALAVCITLTACGGGGSDNTVVPPPTSIYGLQADSSSNYVGDPLTFFARLNDSRRNAGAGTVIQNAALDRAAQNHADYLIPNPYAGHYQERGGPNFIASQPWDRAAMSGYSLEYVAEDIVVTNSGSPDCAPQLLASVYRLGNLMRGARDVGLGVATISSTSKQCVVLTGLRKSTQEQLPAPGKVVNYPFPGQQDVLTGFNPEDETPRPIPSVGGEMGHPILVSMRTQSMVDQAAPKWSVSQFGLREAGGGEVPAYLIVRKDVGLSGGLERFDDEAVETHGVPGHAVLVPRDRLKAGTSYQVTFSGMAGTVEHKASWSFTTRR